RCPGRLPALRDRGRHRPRQARAARRLARRAPSDRPAAPASCRIYVADLQNSILFRIDSIAGDGRAGFTRQELVQLSHVFVDESGRIFMTMLNGTNLIAAMDDIDGAGFVTYGDPALGHQQLRNPCGIAVR
ncbi:hypothetical protein BE11_35635, partial [Sorangium cellulosum]